MVFYYKIQINKECFLCFYFFKFVLNSFDFRPELHMADFLKEKQIDFIDILFGSQTGNAEAIANQINQELKKLGFKSSCNPLDEYTKIEFKPSSLLIVICSTTGDGDPPDNATKFWRFFRKAKKSDTFLNIKYALLGLGDTNYNNFCNASKNLYKKFNEFQMKLILPVEYADDAVGFILFIKV